MTDERDKLPGRSNSARNTAREVPLARPLSSAESVPKALRGQRLEPGRGAPEPVRSEDVEFAVLREVEPRPKHLPLGSTNAADPREARSGTLLSIGSIDPRAPTERSLETPRLFMTQAEAEADVYFTPKPAPRATEHATIETETVKIAQSADPRRAVTQPRLRPPEQPAPVLEAALSQVTSQELSEPSPDEVSTTPEPLAKRRDEQLRVRPVDTLDPKKVSTQPELPRYRRSEAPTIRISHSVPPAEIPATVELAPKGWALWLWVASAAALIALLLVWLVRSRSVKPPEEDAAAVQTSVAAPIAPTSAASPKPAVEAPAVAELAEPAPAPAVSLAPPSSSPAAEQQPAPRPPSKAAEKPTTRESIY